MPIAVDGRQFIHATMQSEMTIGCRSTDIGDSGFPVVIRLLTTTYQCMNSWHVGCCQILYFAISKNRLAKLEVKYAGNAKSETRRKPMLPCLIGNVA